MAHLDASAAEHMDAIYRYQRYVYDLTRKYYLLGRDRLIADLAPPEGGSVLEVACGTGRNLITAARRYRGARFYGFDISNAMLDTARVSIGRSGLAARIQIAHGDATSFSAREMFGVEKFDRVFISYALSMIPPWRGALQQGLSVLAPGGQLFIVDFGNQARLPRWFKRSLRKWLAQFSVSPRDDLSTELDKIAGMPGFKVKRMPLYRGYAVYAVVTRTS